jgi:plastocyanin
MSLESLWRRLGIALLLGTLVFATAACGEDDNDDGADAESDGGGGGGEDDGGGGGDSESGSITIEGSTFADTIEADAGATITVTNNDGVPHTVTADDGDFDVAVDPDSEAELTAPDDPGEYAFHCEIHSGMTSTLVVGG